jgi:outer membrane lipopolysaccharide assembly protein LptE/RlpB
MISMSKLKLLLPLVMVAFMAACGIYKFNDTSIAPDVHTISVYTIDNKAMKVNPMLSNTLTVALQDKYRKLTKLEMLEDGGDLEVSGYITSYEVTPTAVTSEEVAAQNRLTITVKITFKNNKHPEEDFDTSFAAFQDFDSTISLDAVEAQLVDEIVEILVEDIFNRTVANW